MNREDTGDLARDPLLMGGTPGRGGMIWLVTTRTVLPRACRQPVGDEPPPHLRGEAHAQNQIEFVSLLGTPSRTKGGFQIAVAVAVRPLPFTDPESFRKYCEAAVVLFKKEMEEGVHPCEVKLVDED